MFKEFENLEHSLTFYPKGDNTFWYKCHQQNATQYPYLKRIQNIIRICQLQQRDVKPIQNTDSLVPWKAYNLIFKITLLTTIEFLIKWGKPNFVCEANREWKIICFHHSPFLLHAHILSSNSPLSQTLPLHLTTLVIMLSSSLDSFHYDKEKPFTMVGFLYINIYQDKLYITL